MLKYPVISEAELNDFLWHEDPPKKTKSDLDALTNKTIEEVFISSDESVLAFSLKEEKDLIYFQVCGDCCSESWFSDIFCMQNIYSRTIKVENVDLDEKYNTEDARGRQDFDRVYGYRITTMKGVAIVAFRNSSNGYYGGECEQIFSLPDEQNLQKIEPDINGVWQSI